MEGFSPCKMPLFLGLFLPSRVSLLPRKSPERIRLKERTKTLAELGKIPSSGAKALLI
jgi:hypothetical protein